MWLIVERNVSPSKGDQPHFANILFLLTCFFSFKSNAQNPINYVEYYLDQDPGIGKANAVSITSGVNITNASFNIDVANINTGVTERDGHLQGEKWFDAANHPAINFTSSKIEKSENGYNATGTLSIKGITKGLTIPFNFVQIPSKKPIHVFNFISDFTIKRSEFGIGKTDGDVSDEVVLHVEIPVTKEN